VQFRWDLEGMLDENSSVLPASSASVGLVGYGTQFLPTNSSRSWWPTWM